MRNLRSALRVPGSLRNVARASTKNHIVKVKVNPGPVPPVEPPVEPAARSRPEPGGPARRASRDLFVPFSVFNCLRRGVRVAFEVCGLTVTVRSQ